MNTMAIIQQAKSEGLILSISETGGIKFEGNHRAAGKWKPVLREHKVAIIEALKVANNGAPSWRWLLHFADRESVEVTFSPEVNHDEVLGLYPAALAAKPIVSTPNTGQAIPLTTDEERAILTWLESIGEDDPAIIAETLELCRLNTGARSYFMGLRR